MHPRSSLLTGAALTLVLRWLLPLLGLHLFGTAVSGLYDRRKGPSPQEIAEDLGLEMEDMRRRVDACLATRSRIELRFQAHVQRTSELRAELDSLEGLDRRGVPAERYEEYLSLVERFNEATRDWGVLSDELRAFDPSCRELISTHNLLGDSVRGLLEGEGIGELARPPEAWEAEGDSIRR
jgi:hypothetical protein